MKKNLNVIVPAQVLALQRTFSLYSFLILRSHCVYVLLSPIHSDEEEEDYPFDAAAHGYEEEDDDGSIARPPIHLAHLLHNADSPIPDAREVAERFGEQAGWYEDDEERDDYEDEEPRTDYEDDGPPHHHHVERYFDFPAHAMGGGFAEVYPDEHGYDDYYEDGEEDAGEHGGYEYGEDDGYGDEY